MLNVCVNSHRDNKRDKTVDYSEKLMQYFKNTPNCGVLDLSEPGVVMAKVGNPHNGDMLELYIQRSDSIIAKARFKALGSAATVAGAQFICQWLEKNSIKDAGALTNQDILGALDLPSVKIHIASLLNSAVKHCLRELERKSYD